MCQPGDDGKCTICGKTLKNLVLRKDALQVLTADELRAVGGGASGSYSAQQGSKYSFAKGSSSTCCCGTSTHHCAGYDAQRYQSR